MSLQLTRSDMLALSLRGGRAAELHSVRPTTMPDGRHFEIALLIALSLPGLFFVFGGRLPQKNLLFRIWFTLYGALFVWSARHSEDPMVFWLLCAFVPFMLLYQFYFTTFCVHCGAFNGNERWSALLSLQSFFRPGDPPVTRTDGTACRKCGELLRNERRGSTA